MTGTRHRADVEVGALDDRGARAGARPGRPPGPRRRRRAGGSDRVQVARRPPPPRAGRGRRRPGPLPSRSPGVSASRATQHRRARLGGRDDPGAERDGADDHEDARQQPRVAPAGSAQARGDGASAVPRADRGPGSAPEPGCCPECPWDVLPCGDPAVRPSCRPRGPRGRPVQNRRSPVRGMSRLPPCRRGSSRSPTSRRSSTSPPPRPTRSSGPVSCPPSRSASACSGASSRPQLEAYIERMYAETRARREHEPSDLAAVTEADPRSADPPGRGPATVPAGGGRRQARGGSAGRRQPAR